MFQSFEKSGTLGQIRTDKKPDFKSDASTYFATRVILLLVFRIFKVFQLDWFPTFDFAGFIVNFK